MTLRLFFFKFSGTACPKVRFTYHLFSSSSSSSFQRPFVASKLYATQPEPHPASFVIGHHQQQAVITEKRRVSVFPYFSSSSSFLAILNTTSKNMISKIKKRNGWISRYLVYILPSTDPHTEREEKERQESLNYFNEENQIIQLILFCRKRNKHTSHCG